MEAFVYGAHWDKRTINLLIIYTWPLSAVIKDGLLKIFIYEYEKFAYSKYKEELIIMLKMSNKNMKIKKTQRI